MRRLDDATPSAPPSILFSRAALIVISLLLFVVVIGLEAGPDWGSVALPLMRNGVILIAWLLCAFGIGTWVLRAIRVECGTALRVIIGIALGLGLMSLVVLGFGCAGILNRFTAIAILIVGVLGAVVSVRGPAAELRAFFRESARIGWMWLLLVPILSIATTCAVLPPGLLWRDEPNGYDVTEYHLQVPREWFEAGRIIPLHHNVFSFFPF